jgi:hypothetical protein
MPAYAVIAGAYLPHAAPDTAGDVGAVHHDMSPEAPVLFDPDCCFFVKPGQPLRPRTEIPRLKTDVACTRCG